MISINFRVKILRLGAKCFWAWDDNYKISWKLIWTYDDRFLAYEFRLLSVGGDFNR